MADFPNFTPHRILDFRPRRAQIYRMDKKQAAGFTVLGLAGLSAGVATLDKHGWFSMPQNLDAAMISPVSTTTSGAAALITLPILAGGGNLAEPIYRIGIRIPDLKNGGQHQSPKSKT